MSTALPIKIAPDVLIWARTTMGYTPEMVAAKMQLDVAKIHSWENGTSSPTYTQLEKLAYQVFKRPLAVFFRSTPPTETPIKKDFRNLSNAEINHLSTEMRLVLRKAKRLQNLTRQLLEEEPLVRPYQNFSVSVQDNPNLTANRFRAFLGLDIETQKQWKNDAAFEHFKALVENIGIYVFQLQMPFEEARAFALTDDCPIIVLNTEDAKNGRIFSLFHEVCHILFNVGGIFRDKEKQLTGDYADIERFCNHFAAAFLVPEDSFRKEIARIPNNDHQWNDKILQQLANTYNVSKEVILRKLVGLQKVSENTYFKRKNAWNKEAANRKAEKNRKLKEEGRGGGAEAQDSKAVKEKGKPYISKVLEKYESGRLTYADVAQYLEVKLDHLPKIIERLNK
jgi:Zn-dependent peptidase ImmA (M78 family)